MVKGEPGALPPTARTRRGGLLRRLGVVDAEIDRVEPEAVDAAVEPEAGLGQQRLDHLRDRGS